MKKLGFLLIVLFVIYIIQHDIRYGTLGSPNAVPANTQPIKAPAQKQNGEKTAVPYLHVKVKAGDTVLSIVEQLSKSSIPVSIEKVVKDFKALNKGISPENIQIGKKYKFPVYKQT